MLDSVAVLLRSCVRFIDVTLFLVLYNNNNSDVIINLAGLHLDSGWINQQFPVFWGGVHSVQMSPPGGQPDSRQTPGGLHTNIWLGCHQRKNGGWTPGLHLDSARLRVESNWNMWGSVKSSSYGLKKSIGLNWTGPWSGLFFGCGCPNLGLFWLPVASFQKSFKTVQRLVEISCNWLNSHVRYVAL